MPPVCILTDSTVQVSTLGFPGRDLVTIMPLKITLGGKSYADDQGQTVASLPHSADRETNPAILPPEAEVTRQIVRHLNQTCGEIIVLLATRRLLSQLEPLHYYLAQTKNSARLHLFNTQTISAGLGYLVEAAAQAADSGANASEIMETLREVQQRIYSLVCVRSLTYLYHAGFLDRAQAEVGEMLGATPVYLLEQGQLWPAFKASNQRLLADRCLDYLQEIEDLKHVSLVGVDSELQGAARILRQKLLDKSPQVKLREHKLDPVSGALFGPRTLGIFALA
jgi:DegV family protein with EDD domain